MSSKRFVLFRILYASHLLRSAYLTSAVHPKSIPISPQQRHSTVTFTLDFSTTHTVPTLMKIQNTPTVEKTSRQVRRWCANPSILDSTCTLTSDGYCKET
ncbi:hypothetical protein QCA50_019581 [Cerrena zonata]|uniref:Secreted protein n=1 Tax=Cerrena zonata TaxID=2478898 RepID=A0AAW0F987_9APHY